MAVWFFELLVVCRLVVGWVVCSVVLLYVVGWFALAVFGFTVFVVNSVGHFSLFVLDFVGLVVVAAYCFGVLSVCWLPGCGDYL